MKRQIKFFLLVFLLLTPVITSCAGFISTDEETSSGDFGPRYSPAEHQARTLEALWQIFRDNYIYYETANVDWLSLSEKYNAKVDDGLTNDEFIALMRSLETELPEGSLVYQSRAERIESDTADTSTYEGIGAFVGFQAEETPHIVVLGVIEGSPAEEAGIRPHDSIFEIDGNPILLEEGIDVVKRVRGPAGSTVTLNVQTPGSAERVIEVTRAELVSRGQLEARQIEGTKYGYILFPPITYDTLLEDVLANLQTFSTNQQLEGLILDLRVAGSSAGWPLQELMTMFHNGLVGDFYNNVSQKQTLRVNGQDLFGSQSVPLVVLVGQNTNGFPEILAASLQANERAFVIGESTPGAVETATGFYLPDGSRVFIETTSFKLPNGDDIGLSGVQPKYPVEAGWDDVIPGNDPVLDKALELLGTE